MLADHPIQPVLLVRDLAAARAFYTETLGLPLVGQDDARLVVRCGSGTLTLSLSTVGTTDTQTKAAWTVEDIDAEVDELRSRGVQVEEYDSEDLRTVDGIADVGFARAAWIVDPFDNALSLLEPID
ncbi:MAG: VOC family protein [Solirubrobacterales bacterium]